MLESGLAAQAEARGLVLLFPQASTHGPDGGGCWDWRGATSADFDTRSFGFRKLGELLWQQAGEHRHLGELSL